MQAANKLINWDGVFIMVANGGTPMNNATMLDQLAKGVANVFPLTPEACSMYEPARQPPGSSARLASYYDQMRCVKLFVEQHHSRWRADRQDTDFGRDVATARAIS